MNILLGLAPFIAFFVLMRLSTPLIALSAAFVIAAALMAQGWWKGASVKISRTGQRGLVRPPHALHAGGASGLEHRRRSARGRRRADADRPGVARDPPALHPPIRARAGGAGTLGSSDFHSHQQYHHRRLVGRVPGDDPLRRRRDIPAVNSARGRDRGDRAAIVGAVWFSVWYPARVRRNIRVQHPRNRGEFACRCRNCSRENCAFRSLARRCSSSRCRSW